MKVRDKISGEVYEAVSWKDWRGRTQIVKAGTNGPIRDADEVEEIIEEIIERTEDTTDWAAFRRGAAKDILCVLLGPGWNPFRTIEDAVKTAIDFTDELIKQLKEEEK